MGPGRFSRYDLYSYKGHLYKKHNYISYKYQNDLDINKNKLTHCHLCNRSSEREMGPSGISIM